MVSRCLNAEEVLEVGMLDADYTNSAGLLVCNKGTMNIYENMLYMERVKIDKHHAVRMN